MRLYFTNRHNVRHSLKFFYKCDSDACVIMSLCAKQTKQTCEKDMYKEITCFTILNGKYNIIDDE